MVDNNGCVVALGNFDGLHKGHKAVLNAALAFKDLKRIFSKRNQRGNTGEFPGIVRALPRTA